MLTVVGLGLFDHTLDGILDVVSLNFLLNGGLFKFNVTVAAKEGRHKNKVSIFV